MVTVSVVVPFYNQKRYLGECLRSVLDQTLSDFEIIVVDDGSPEDPADVIAALGDGRITMIRQVNAGVAAARNTAIAASRGRFLAFLDADDALAPTMLETLVGCLEQSTTAAMAYCDIVHVDEHGGVADAYTIARTRARLSGDILPSLMVGGYFPPCCVLARASIVKALGGFDPSLGGCCDWDLWIRMAADGHHAIFDERKLAYYRRHGDSMSRNLQHMRQMETATLRKNMSRKPSQLAGAVQELIETCSRLYAANIGLQTALEQFSNHASNQDAVAKGQGQLCLDLAAERPDGRQDDEPHEQPIRATEIAG